MADKRAERIAELIEPLRVKPGSKVNLSRDFDPGYKADFVKKKDGRSCCGPASSCWPTTRRRLAAQDTYGVLVCLQALDAGGKDGTIRHVMSGVNPQGVQVSELQGALGGGARPRLPVALRPPPARTRRHRDLQPVALRGGPRGPGAPGDTSTGRSCRDDAKGKGMWERRYREINDWERYLTDNGFKRGEAVPEPVEGGAADPVLQAARPAGEELEVLGRRRPGAPVLG